MFSSTYFSGHKDTVLDIKLSCAGVVATSSEDKTIRLWDTRVGTRAVQCIIGFGDLPVENLMFSDTNVNSLFGNTENAILQFDLRFEGVINRQHTVVYAQDTDVDISCFDMHPECNLIAVGCDDGSVCMIDQSSRSITKRLSRVHNNILGAVAFARRNPNVLVTGGFDSLCCAWDIVRGRPVSRAIDFSSQETESSVSTQISNPPFVHAILPLLDGRTVACALGDGTVHLLNACAGPFQPASAATEAHAGMVTALATYGPTSVAQESTMTGETEGTVVDAFLSCGADRNIVAWNVIAGEEPASTASSGAGGRKKKTGKNKKTSPPGHRLRVQRSFTIEHVDKINTIATHSRGCASTGGGNEIFVADVTSRWVMYTLSEASSG